MTPFPWYRNPFNDTLSNFKALSCRLLVPVKIKQVYDANLGFTHRVKNIFHIIREELHNVVFSQFLIHITMSW